MTYTGTHEELFTPPVDPHSLFEKSASLSRMPDDEKKWPAHLLSEIHKALPFLSDYDIDMSLDRVDPESGAALGYAMVRNKSVKNMPVEDIDKPSNRLRIPLIIQDRMLQPFHTFELGGQVYPLTPTRLEAAMVNPAVFDSDVARVPASSSLVDQIYPPYQQRQGFGRISESNGGADGSSKLGSAAPMEKEARLYHGMSIASSYRRFDDEWLEGFTGTPFYKEAMSMYEEEALRQASHAESRARRAISRADDATFEIKIATVESEFAKWKFSEHGVKVAETIDKLSCRSGTKHWSDEFAMSPFFKEALVLEAESSVRHAKRAARDAIEDDWALDRAMDKKSADLDAKVAQWRVDKYFGAGEKKASGDLLEEMSQLGKDRSAREAGWEFFDQEKHANKMLMFRQGVGLPGMMVFQKMEPKPRFRSGVVGNDFWFYPLQGTQFWMGVHKSYRKGLEAESDQRKVRQKLAGPMRAEMMAARANMPSPGRFILVAKVGEKYKYVKPEFTPALAAMGGGEEQGVNQALRKAAAWSYDNHDNSCEISHPGLGHSEWAEGQAEKRAYVFGAERRHREMRSSINKKAGAPLITGASLGYGAGSLVAESSARATAPVDKKERAAKIARTLAIVGVSLGAALAALAGKKVMTPKIKEALRKLKREDLQFLASTVGPIASGIIGGIASGAAVGAVTGGVMSLRDKLREMKGKK